MSSNFSHLIPQPELDIESDLKIVDQVFDDFRKLFNDVDAKTSRATKKKEKILQELKQLTAQVSINSWFSIRSNSSLRPCSLMSRLRQ